MNLAIILVILFGSLENEAKEVPCEKFEDFNEIISQKTCIMNKATTIDTKGTKISSARDEAVEGLKLSANTKINFLPEEVAENFQNLWFYSAVGCSVKEISKTNFRHLSKLRVLELDHNQIERIDSDTFDDLVLLQYLALGKSFLIAVRSTTI